MSEQKFRRGDLVTLRSGGPVMTVDREAALSWLGSAPTEIICVWFDGSKKVQESFSIKSLKPALRED